MYPFNIGEKFRPILGPLISSFLPSFTLFPEKVSGEEFELSEKMLFLFRLQRMK